MPASVKFCDVCELQMLGWYIGTYTFWLWCCNIMLLILDSAKNGKQSKVLIIRVDNKIWLFLAIGCVYIATSYCLRPRLFQHDTCVALHLVAFPLQCGIDAVRQRNFSSMLNNSSWFCLSSALSCSFLCAFVFLKLFWNFFSFLWWCFCMRELFHNFNHTRCNLEGVKSGCWITLYSNNLILLVTCHLIVSLYQHSLYLINKVAV